MLDYLSLYRKYLGLGKHVGGGEYVFSCWRCNDTRGRPALKLYVNASNGLYCCHKCRHNPDGYGEGSAKKFAKLMNDTSILKHAKTSFATSSKRSVFNPTKAIEVYTYMIEHTTLSFVDRIDITENRGIQDPENSPYYLRSSGNVVDMLRNTFDKDQLLKAGLFFNPSGVGSKILPYRCILPDRVIIPYCKDNKVVYFRSRGKDTEGNTTYFGPSMAPSRYHVWGFPMINKSYLIVTEGEFKAMSAVSHGFNCVALPGMGTAHSAFANLCDRLKVKNVVICFDTQIENMQNVDGAADKLAQTVKKKKGTRVFRAHLPLSPDISNGEKIDIDTFLVAKGSEAFKEVINAAQEV